MDYDAAEKLMRCYMNINGALNDATQITNSIQDIEERHYIRRILSNIGQDVFLELMRPITKKYPDLDPD